MTLPESSFTSVRAMFFLHDGKGFHDVIDRITRVGKASEKLERAIVLPVFL